MRRETFSVEHSCRNIHHRCDLREQKRYAFVNMKTPTLPPTNHSPQKYTGPSAADVLAQRKQFMNPAIFLYYKTPLMLVEGRMQYVWDDTGKRYLDGLGGIV